VRYGERPSSEREDARAIARADAVMRALADSKETQGETQL
jgi:hypothetical protein